jgi:hypothetical protein|tara:strand:+ start:2002 stop:2154 length:153 start_codon:yes stop_codon:yes gene_type:complete
MSQKKKVMEFYKTPKAAAAAAHLVVLVWSVGRARAAVRGSLEDAPGGVWW